MFRTSRECAIVTRSTRASIRRRMWCSKWRSAARHCVNCPLFAAVGVPEVWRSDWGKIVILIRDGDRYLESSISLAFPVLTGEVVTRFLAESQIQPRPDWFQAASDWARAQRTAQEA